MGKAPPAENKKIDFRGDPVYCYGRSKKSWKQLAFFYTIFYGCLVSFFAINYAVMFDTLPHPDFAGPKSTHILKPGVAFFPRNINSGGLCSDPDFATDRVRRYQSAVSSFFRRAADFDPSSRRPLRLSTQTEAQINGNASNVVNADFGQCATLADALSLSEQGKFCVYAKLNRVYNFGPVNIANSVSLDFPSDSRFQSDYGVPFTTFATVSPATLNLAVPFTNDPTANYIDPVFAILFDTTTVYTDCGAATPPPTIKLFVNGIFDWGQGPEEGEGKGDVYEFEFRF